MKKLLYLPLSLLLLVSCGKSSKQRELEEEERYEDSIAEVARAERAAEQARLDSLRQDSIEKIQKFEAVLPTFPEVNSAANNRAFAKLFKSKGYTISYGKGKGWNNETMDYEPVKTVIATYKLDDDHSCTFQEFMNDRYGWKITINGAPEKLEEFAALAKAQLQKEKSQNAGDWYYQEAFVKSTGNTVTWSFPLGD